LDINKIIQDLRSERDRIGRAIDILLSEARATITGRPTARTAAAPRKRRGGGLTAAGRRRLSEAMKRRWAERRTGKSTASATKPKRRGGGLTPAGRKKLSEAMKKRWAERRKKAS
jgi:hypothetical protein